MGEDQTMSSTLAAFGLDGIKYLDEISDRNLVWSFRSQLTRGATNELGHGVRKRMIVNGILVRHGFKWELTIKGKRILEGLRENSPSL
jgi:hypothetical protein